jgi:serine/threonine protein kinase
MPQVFLHILASVLAGLEHMHTLTDGAGRSLAAIHYDIKPDNVLVFPGEHDNVTGLQFKVSDLGATRYTATLRQRRAEDPGHTVVSLRIRPQSERGQCAGACWRRAPDSGYWEGGGGRCGLLLT